MTGAQLFALALFGVTLFGLGFLAGNRYTVQFCRLDELENTRRVVWMADWVRRRQKLLAISGGHPDVIAELARLDQAAFPDIPEDAFDRFERQSPPS